MTLLDFIPVWRHLPEGWLSCEEAAMLLAWAERTSGDIVEVGSHLGRSAILLASTGRTVHCVDPWEGGTVYRQFRDNTQHLRNVVAHRCHVEGWKPIPAGFVYLDGDHSDEGTLRQIQAALLCNPQVVAMHDVGGHSEGERVERVAREALGAWTDKLAKVAVWRMRS